MEQFGSDFLIKDLYDMLLEECEQYAEGLFDDPYDPWARRQTPEEYRRERLEGRKRGEAIYLIRYLGNDEHVRVPDGVTNIDRCAFADNDTLRSVILPDSVLWIGTEAFKNCHRLASIQLGSNLNKVGVNSFENCFSLRKIVFPDTTKYIGSATFYNCPVLTEVDLGNGMEEIEEEAFKKCKSLKEIVLPESMRMFDLRAFEGTGVQALYIPKNVSYITSMEYGRQSPLKKIEVDPKNPHLYSKGNCIFLRETNCLLGVVRGFVLPQDGSLRDIGENLFKNNKSLTKYCVPTGVETIWYGAFSGCINLRHIDLPDTLRSILACAFEKCISLEEIIIPGSVKTVSHYAFQGAGLKKVVLKRGVEAIEHAAFSGCTSLGEVYLPCTLNKIEGLSVFSGCSENLRIYIEQGSEKNYEKILKNLENFHVEFIARSEIFD